MRLSELISYLQNIQRDATLVGMVDPEVKLYRYDDRHIMPREVACKFDEPILDYDDNALTVEIKDYEN